MSPIQDDTRDALKRAKERSDVITEHGESIESDPRWQRLAEKFKEDEGKVSKALGAKLMAGAKVSEEEIAFMRGFAAAIKRIFEYPESVAKQMENAAFKAYQEEQEALAEGEDTPYT